MTSIHKLKDGDVLAKPILGSDGRVLLQAGVALSGAFIRRLQRLNLSYVYIQDADTTDIDSEDTVSLDVQQEVMAKVKSIYGQAANAKTGEKFIKSGQFGAGFSDLFKTLFDALMLDRTLMVNLTAIYTSDAYLYSHSMRVGIIASVLGMAYGLNQDRLQQFGLGAMLHDIGKLKIDPRILNKPGKLTEEERNEVEQHPRLGYEMLKDQTDVSLVSAHCALQHHEKFDGTGYPRKLKGKQIHEFGRLLALADVYDALVSNRAYRSAFLPHEAMEYLFAQSGRHFDPELVTLFIRHINIYPNGLPVQLSNGAAGVVSRPNPGTLQRPVILVLTEQGQRVKPYELDLAQTLNVTIVSCNLDEVEIISQA